MQKEDIHSACRRKACHENEQATQLLEGSNHFSKTSAVALIVTDPVEPAPSSPPNGHENTPAKQNVLSNPDGLRVIMGTKGD